MKKVNVAHVRAEQRQSPGGKYAKTVKEISIALGREPDSLDLAKRHPFDLTLVRISPGKAIGRRAYWRYMVRLNGPLAFSRVRARMAICVDSLFYFLFYFRVL